MNISNIIKIHGELYQVKRKLPEHQVDINKVENGASLLKQYYHCDTLFRAKGYLWLCNKINSIDYENI